MSCATSVRPAPSTPAQLRRSSRPHTRTHDTAVSDREGAHELTSTDAVELLVAKLTTTTADGDNATVGDLEILQLNRSADSCKCALFRLLTVSAAFASLCVVCVSCVSCVSCRAYRVRVVSCSALALRSIVLNSERVEAADVECMDVPTAGFVAVRKHVDQILEIYRESVVSAKHSSAGTSPAFLRS